MNINNLFINYNGFKILNIVKASQIIIVFYEEHYRDDRIVVLGMKKEETWRNVSN